MRTSNQYLTIGTNEKWLPRHFCRTDRNLCSGWFSWK